VADELHRIFLNYSAEKLRQMAERIENCLSGLTEEQIWARAGDNQNAIGNLVLHLSGNVRQWIVSGIGGLPDTRRRDAEFAARGEESGPDLVARLKAAVEDAAGVLAGLSSERLSQRIVVQHYDVTILEAVYHVVEHFSGHTGQIIFATKVLTGKDLGFYQHLRDAAAHGRKTP
jgi:uncharacterized damage-inducible protein DinB